MKRVLGPMVYLFIRWKLILKNQNKYDDDIPNGISRTELTVVEVCIERSGE